jgi:hypothetical protein
MRDSWRSSAEASRGDDRMAANPRVRPVTATRRARRRREGDDPMLPGLAEALEVYRRISELRGAPVRAGSDPGQRAEEVGGEEGYRDQGHEARPVAGLHRVVAPPGKSVVKQG